MSVSLKHHDAMVRIDILPNGKKRVLVPSLKKSIFMPHNYCETTYPIELIQLILNVIGPVYLCDEIRRDEDSSYLQRWLEVAILGYVQEDSFDNKRILDFGCGSGASTVILARARARYITNQDETTTT